MKNFKVFLLAALLGSVSSSRAELDINGKIQVIPIPERSHAAINFSGSSANDVDMVALDDAGNAAYAAPEPHSTPGNVVSNTLQNSLRNRAPDNFVPMRWTTVEGEEVVEYYAAAGLTTNGDLYFSLSSYGNAAELCGIRSARVIAGIPAYLSLPPPFVRDLRHVTLELDISGANESGYWGGGGGATDNSYSAYGGFFFLRAGGQFTIFDGTFKSQYQYQPWIGYRIPSAGSLQVVTANFAPNLANANGWALGNTVAGYWAGRAASPLLWNGQEVIPLPGYGVALNNSNDVLIASSDPGNDMAALLDRGNIFNRRPLRQAGSSPGLIPLPLQSQIRNIRPLHLSNRRTIAGTEIQPVLHIVFAAETLRDPGRDAWEQAVFVLRMLSNNTTDLYEIPGARNLNVRSINNTGLLAAIGTPGDQISKQALLLVPVDIAVDANRDGIIKFAGNASDNALARKPYDKTKEAKPFRFWINDDNDGNSGAGEENVDSTRKDFSDGLIKSTRDLEDFTRLHVHIGSLHDEIANGIISVGLEWRNATGTPSIKVYQAAEADGGDQYLKTERDASSQILGATATTLGTVSTGASFKLPVSFWQPDPLAEKPALSADHPNRYLIFEGAGEGKGQLVLTFWRGSTWLGEGGSVWVDLVDVRKMYQRLKATGVSDDAPEPSQVSNSQPADPAMAWAPVEGEEPYELNAARSWEEAKHYIVFVHGWNMSDQESQNFADTMFKRLWQRGYKGRFASMRWPTLNDSFATPVGEVPYTYNASEYRAWKCGESLKQFVNKLPAGYTRNLVAHSLGNVVVGAALKKKMILTNYALLNGAVSAGCYDDRQILDQGWGYSTPFNDSDPATSSLSHRKQLAGVVGNLVNFFLPDDDALLKWEWNNDTPGGLIVGPGNQVQILGSKPQRYNLGMTGYYYDQAKPAGKRLGINYPTVNGRFVTTAHESMAYVAQSPMKAIGAEGRALGAIDGKVDMSDYSFEDAHSAEFEFPLQRTVPFYNRMMEELDLSFLP